MGIGIRNDIVSIRYAKRYSPSKRVPLLVNRTLKVIIPQKNFTAKVLNVIKK